MTPYREVPTRIVSTLSGYKFKEVLTDQYGGRKDQKVKATGFYYPKKLNGRWWIIDPEGHLYLHNAVNAVNMGGSERNKIAQQKVFGDENNWIKQTQQFLTQNGFNGAGAWSNVKMLQKGNAQSDKKLSYTINLDFMSSYGLKRGGTFQLPGHRGYPNNVIFVFDPQFETFCLEYAKKILEYKNDQNLFGYFSDNEMPLGLKNLEGYLTLKDKNDPGYLAAKKWAEANRVDQNNITDAQRSAFLEVIAEKYFSVVSKAIKKYDANHMYLGCRFHGQQGTAEALWKTAGNYVDAISMNYYNAWTPDQQLLAKWARWSGKPFIITEWYVKGDDSGLGNTAGAGWIVKTQEERGLFYQNFVLGLMESKNCVGWHWFKYLDNDPTQKGAEPSNTNANKGIVDNDYEIYKPLVARMAELNKQMYSLVDYFDRNSSSK